jgi:transposase
MSSRLKLNQRQRTRLRRQLKTASDARLYRRTLAVLELDRGRSPAEIAEMLGVTRQSVHNWARLYTRDFDPSDLDDEDRTGRPPLLASGADEFLRSLLSRSPQGLGHPDTSWTTPLLRGELERGLGVKASDDTVRRALRRLGYTWKRPRYVLAPDPEREKKTPDSASDPGFASSQRRARRGRDRPDDVPAVAIGMVAAGRTGQGRAERLERAPGDLRGDEPEDRDADVDVATQKSKRRLSSLSCRTPRSLSRAAYRAVARRGAEPYGEGISANGRRNDAVVAAEPRTGVEPHGHLVGPRKGRGFGQQAVRDHRGTRRTLPRVRRRLVGARGTAYCWRPLR